MADFSPETNWPVLFRKARKGGDVIAIFPYDAASDDPYLCGCYVHVGQHGTCEPHGAINNTRLAKPVDYAALKAELERPPCNYRFRVLKRYPRQSLDFRRAELERQRRHREAAEV